MLSPTSPVFDAYPQDFALDLNGKRADWEAVALLPFIDEQRLLTAIEEIDPQLTDVERSRNVLGDDLYYTPDGSDYTPAMLPEAERVGAATKAGIAA